MHKADTPAISTKLFAGCRANETNDRPAWAAVDVQHEHPSQQARTPEHKHAHDHAVPGEQDKNPQEEMCSTHTR